MIPYLLLIFMPFIAQFWAINKKNKHFVIGDSAYVKNNNVSINVFFFLLTLLLMLRHETVGRDLANYKYIFEICSNKPLEGLMKVNIEPLYAFINWLIGQVTDNYQILIAVFAAATIIPIWNIYKKDSRYGYLKIILFVNMSTFLMFFSGIRQALAMALGMVAFHFVQKKSFVKYIIVCIVAIGIHTSAFMLFFMYPLYYANLKKRHLGWILIGIAGVFVLNSQIFSFLGKILYAVTDYSAEITSTNAYGTLVLFFLFLLFVYFISDETKMTREAVGLRNFLVLCVILQCFAPLHTLAMRMGYYYILFIPLVIADALKYRKQKYEQIANMTGCVLQVFFTILFVWTIYQGYATGYSALDTIPYILFWKG